MVTGVEIILWMSAGVRTILEDASESYSSRVCSDDDKELL